METEFQAPTQSKSLADLMGNYVMDTRSERQKFTDEAVKRINNERLGTKWKPVTERAIAIIINYICPKEGGDSLVIDTRKACNEGKKGYGNVLFGIYNKQKKG